jgi:hypothetical protein
MEQRNDALSIQINYFNSGKQVALGNSSFQQLKKSNPKNVFDLPEKPILKQQQQQDATAVRHVQIHNSGPRTPKKIESIPAVPVVITQNRAVSLSQISKKKNKNRPNPRSNSPAPPPMPRMPLQSNNSSRTVPVQQKQQPQIQKPQQPHFQQRQNQIQPPKPQIPQMTNAQAKYQRHQADFLLGDKYHKWLLRCYIDDPVGLLHLDNGPIVQLAVGLNRLKGIKLCPKGPKCADLHCRSQHSYQESDNDQASRRFLLIIKYSSNLYLKGKILPIILRVLFYEPAARGGLTLSCEKLIFRDKIL